MYFSHRLYFRGGWLRTLNFQGYNIIEGGNSRCQLREDQQKTYIMLSGV